MARRKIVRWSIIAVLGVVVLGAGGDLLASKTDGYSVDIVVPSAAQLLPGSPVWIGGLQAGSVDNLEVRDGKAVIHASLSKDHGPLHDGTTSRIEWNSVIGERVLTLYPGPGGNAPIPDGGMVEGQSSQIEIDEVLAALDPPTRARLSSLIGGLNDTTSGEEQQLQGTLQTAGPAVHALGSVLDGIGRDGPAIHDLVGQLNQLTAVAAQHDQDIAGTVRNLSTLADSVAQEQSAISESLGELPDTLRTARDTLDRVPHAGDVTTPLLKDLDPATRKLSSVARNLSPVFQELRPTVAELGPLLVDAQQLLGKTPALLDTSHDVLPPAQNVVQSYQPAVAYLRPYTPELIGWLQNFGQSFAGYDSQGHFWAATLAPGTNALDESVVQPPGSYTSARPVPGEVVGQPWTDAHGSGMK
jgi:phospholipid/cholesterol/gamma-HCH transport system substrate-binding protein